MTVLITMAGLGSRFANEGYTVPKYKVRARGRTLFEWSMLSLRKFFGHPFVFATIDDGEDHSWLVSMAKSIGIAASAVVSRSTLSSGQAETAFDALHAVEANEPLWIYNIDTYVSHGMHPSDMGDHDGCVHVFPSSHPGMSYVAYDDTGVVTRLAEKQVISQWATVGMYGFASATTFLSAYAACYDVPDADTLVGGERFIAPMYERMLRQGLRLVAPKLASENVHVLGTPAQVQDFDPLALPPLGDPV